MKRACVSLISGGLDSALATKLMLDQGIQVYGLFLAMSWGCCEKPKAIAVADRLGVPLMVIGVGDAYLDVVRNPKYGYGTQMNPCVDCRIYMFKIAKKYMEEVGAAFIVTGEVLGQRPMSQRSRPLGIIKRDSGLEDLLLRPLSAQLLEPTLPEREGIVDRSKLLEINGRSRQDQLTLAKQFDLNGYSQPAGGCQLTDPHFAAKAKDLFAHEAKPTTRDMEMLTVGRHFRLNDSTKVILGRNQLENLMLEGYADAPMTLVVPKFPGPAALVVGPCDEAATQDVFRLIVQHSKPEKLPPTLDFRIGRQTVSVERAALGQTETMAQMVSG
jgi:hypothetical protein